MSVSWSWTVRLLLRVIRRRCSEWLNRATNRSLTQPVPHESLCFAVKPGKLRT